MAKALPKMKLVQRPHIWYIRLRDKEGKWWQISTGTTDRKEAQQFYIRWRKHGG